MNDNVKSKLISYSARKPTFNKEISKRIVTERSEEEPVDRYRPVPIKKGNKKLIIVNSKEPTELVVPASKDFENKYSSSEALVTPANNQRFKRRRDDDEDSVEDGDIDSTLWKV